MKNEVLKQYVDHTQIIEVDHQFLESLENSKKGSIDYDYKYA